ncbi:MAG: hypothetical protein JNG86_20325 [Verrucomicrobiaceae bacterium]|nr:hypothetical protein [Verrucomicrobiaceae bacterium]
MVTRLTALLLSFCIGLPMCWCCVGEAMREEQAGCCTTEHLNGCAAQQPGSSDKERESCPCCEHRKDPRDAAKAWNFTPKPESRPVMHLAGWQNSLQVLTVAHSPAITTARHERGPPLDATPLYVWHRALLL